MAKTIDGIFGPSTEFEEGFYEGAVRTAVLPFPTDLGRALKQNNQERGLASREYVVGKVLGSYFAFNTCVSAAWILYDILK